LLGIGAILLAMGAAPTLVTAHVNRTAGPYAFFLVLIEEPTFETDRAGFEFSVRDGDRVVRGLDRTVVATASNATQQLSLAVSPIGPGGFYDIERDLQGRPFDPGKGGDWTLHLSGGVEGLPVSLDFPVTFPAYPRTSNGAPAATPQAVDATFDLWTVVDVALLVGAIGWVALRLRSRPRSQRLEPATDPGDGRPYTRPR
jgi:hypothetical protein